MSLAQINKNIKAVITSGAKLNALIHDTAMMIANHAKEHGDCSAALRLAFAMPASMRRTMLVLWFDKFTPIRMNLENNKVILTKPETVLPKNVTPYCDFDLESGAASPFWALAEQNKEKAPEVLDFAALVKLVQGLATRIDSKVEKGEVAPEFIEAAKALSSKVKAIKIAEPKAAVTAKAEAVKPANSNKAAKAPAVQAPEAAAA